MYNAPMRLSLWFYCLAWAVFIFFTAAGSIAATYASKRWLRTDHSETLLHGIAGALIGMLVGTNLPFWIATLAGR